MTVTLCPCCSGKLYSACCEPYHLGTPAPTALALMRSRYAAYSRENAQYIMDTTHPSNPSFLRDSQVWAAQILAFCQSTQFKHLEVLGSQDGKRVAFVTFTAHLLQNQRDATFTERSRFVKVHGRWFYREGTSL